MAISATNELDRAEWLAQRRFSVGGSEAAAAIGVDPYKSPFQLWSEKTGLAEPADLSGNEAVEFGVRLERPILDAFAQRSTRWVAPWDQSERMTHAIHPWMTCTPDAFQARGDEQGTVQIKTTSAYMAKEWDDGPPLHYQVQCQHEMAVCNVTFATLVVLIGGQRLRYFDLDRNDKFIDALTHKLAQFWTMVESHTPPPVDGSLATAKTLLRLHPDDTGEEIYLPPESLEWAAEIEETRAIIKAAEERKDLAENQMMAAIGSNTFGILPNGKRWSWKTQERKGYSVKPSKTRVLRAMKG